MLVKGYEKIHQTLYDKSSELCYSSVKTDSIAQLLLHVAPITKNCYLPKLPDE